MLKIWNGRCDKCGTDVEDLIDSKEIDTHTAKCPEKWCRGTLRPFNFPKHGTVPGVNDPRGKKKDELNKYAKEHK